MPYGVLADIFCIILGGIIGPNLNIKITKCERKAPKFIYGDISLSLIHISEPTRH